MQLEDYFDFRASDDIRLKRQRIGIERRTRELPLFGCYFRRIAQSDSNVRRYRVPSDTTGEAVSESPNSF